MTCNERIARLGVRKLAGTRPGSKRQTTKETLERGLGVGRCSGCGRDLVGGSYARQGWLDEGWTSVDPEVVVSHVGQPGDNKDSARC